MSAFIDPNSTEVLGAFVVMISGFYTIAKVMLKQSSKDRDADRVERQTFIKAINKMSGGMDKVAESNKKIAVATEQGNKEAKDRNGHLAELVLEQGKQTQKIASTAVEQIIKGVKVQHIDKQEVEHMHVKEADKE